MNAASVPATPAPAAGGTTAEATTGTAADVALRVLIVDDDEVDRMIVRRGLSRGGPVVSLDEAGTAYDALALVAERTYDCVFLDYNIPGGDGLTLLRGIKGAGLDLPVVMLTGQGDEQVAVALMKAGAVDYIPKSALTPERLAQSLRFAVDLSRAAAAMRRAEEERRASADRTARLQRVTALLATAVSTDDVARLFMTQLREALGADTAWIAMRTADGTALAALASVGFDAQAISNFDRIPIDESIPAADTVRDGEARFYASKAELFAAYPGLAAPMEGWDQEAVAVLPLELGAEPFGAMTLGLRETRTFSEEDRAFVLALARQCAQALERARLYERERQSRTEAERLAGQLARAALAITRESSLEGVIREITEQARAIVGAHQAVTSMTVDANWAQAINAVSLSDKYARWRDYAVPPTGTGIYHLVVRDGASLRMTQAELEAHPAWRGFGAEEARHPPMRGWLAAPLVGGDGGSLGLIQLSDKCEGEFTPADESILIQLAQMASAAVENARLRQRAETARAEAEEANRAKSEFLARMSHDLRTPLNAIGGYTQLMALAVYGPVTDQQQAALGRVRHAQEHLLTLINDILSFAKLEAGQVSIELGPVPVAEVVDELTALVRADAVTRGLTFSTDAGPTGLEVRADRARLMQILINLASNALKFTATGGVTVSAGFAGEWVEIRVADTGRGIPSDRLELIFDPFVQARGIADEQKGGVGLGLAISRELARLMGGSLTVESEEGRGSTFTTRLPAG